MKKFKYLLILLLFAFCFIPFKIHASGGVSISTSNLSITKGSSKTFTITANNSAGKINISTSNSSVASVSTSSIFLDMASETITVTGNSTGSATITVYTDDVTTYDDENISGKSYTINVAVNEPASTTVTPAPSNNTNTKKDTTINNNIPIKILSNNNKLKELSITDHELNKIDDNNYELIVANNISSIVINASAEDDKSSVDGTGEKNLEIGENNILVTITSESGVKNIINIKVTRKDGYYIEDLNDALKDSLTDKTQIILNSTDKISKEILKEIKDSKKEVSLNFNDENKKMIYSWIIDGSKIKDIKEFVPTLSFTSKNTKDIMNTSNYADGIYVHFDHSGDLPKGTKIKLYVGNKFENNSLTNIYYYNPKTKKLESIQEKLIVKDEYIEFGIDHCSEYFITMSDIKSAIPIKNINKFLVISIVEAIIIILFVTSYCFKIDPILKIKNLFSKKI